MKQSDMAARMDTIRDMAVAMYWFIRRLFPEKPVPPPDGWDVKFEFTVLGGISVWPPYPPRSDTNAAVMKLARALAWLYPGPGETAALRENAKLRELVGDAERMLVIEHRKSSYREPRDGGYFRESVDEWRGKVSALKKPAVQP